ncbi:PREDICTED: multivesicular body subunit 12A isoform X2 [Lepidothrix coronata]|uniref:Multivesicular body subunit 12A n=1 Tax=Lepidothrix coronata TaxID=321398 RepID=A0A6J0J7B9_9PASS|nr:PREDICTED: multivesicular body subunit 12A isoform X2 [Lepidothrix coronata]
MEGSGPGPKPRSRLVLAAPGGGIGSGTRTRGEGLGPGVRPRSRCPVPISRSGSRIPVPIPVPGAHPGAPQPPPCPVVTDVLVLSERSPQPPGYTRAPEFPEPRTGVSRRKRLLVKLEQPSGAAAVLELQLSSKGKVLPLYTKIGEMGGFAIWCKKGPVGPRPSPGPRPLSTGMEQLSLQPPRPPPPSSTKGRSHPESLPDPSGIYGLSAMDGVPFALHPKFEPKLSSGPAPILADLTVKSLADIEQEYNYGFVVERTAAARLPPGT